MKAHVSVPDHKAAPESAWFEQIYPKLHRIACVVAPPDVEPDDLVQDALVQFLQRSDKVLVRSPEAFLAASIVNRASNARRSWVRSRAAYRLLGLRHTVSPTYPSDIGSLLQLPPRERAVLYLHYVELAPFGEIGRQLGCSTEAARKAAERGRDRLRRIRRENSST